MKVTNKNIYFFVVVLCCLLVSCHKTIHEREPGEYDDLASLDATNRTHKHQTFWATDKVISDVQSRDSIRKKLDAELKDPNVKLDSRTRMEYLAMLVKVCRANACYVEAMNYCNEGVVIAARENDIEMNAFFQSNMGQMLFDVEEYSGAGAHLWNAYVLLSTTKDPRLMKAGGIYAMECFEFEFQIMHYETCKLNIDVALKHFENSYELDPSLWTKQEYDSLYGTALIDMARLQARIDNHQEGEKYYNQFLATDYSKTNDGIFHEVRYLFRDKQYEKALERYTVLEQRVDTMNIDYEGITAALPRMRLRKVVILQAMERWKECCEAFESYEDARHYWTKCSSNFKMIEAYERYGVEREQAFSIDTKRVAKERAVVIGFLVVLLVVFIIMSIVLLRMQKIIRKKNKVLAEKLSRQLDESKAVQEKMDKKHNNDEPDAETAEVKEPSNNDPANAKQVERFIGEIVSRKLFCNVDFDRNVLLDELNISRRPFPHLFEEYTGKSVSQFILNLRLEFAADLIRRKPEYTIDSIAQDSGFSGRSTFYRNFVTQFGITPTEYKKQIQESA